jgi:hypothetical protein
MTRAMIPGRSIIITIISLCAALTSAQTPATQTPEQMQASYDAHKGDFDYLLGDWEYSADSRDYRKFRGYWSAVRLDGGEILDDYRVVGDKGQTFYVTSTVRSYNKMLDRWELVGMAAGNGLQDVGTARRVGAEMHIEQRFGVGTDRPTTLRIRYFNIQADRFSWTADRSTDGGKTWEFLYSCRRAIIGSIREARRAGTTHANAATPTRMTETAATVVM